jgi:hypothetical protein
MSGLSRWEMQRGIGSISPHGCLFKDYKVFPSRVLITFYKCARNYSSMQSFDSDAVCNLPTEQLHYKQSTYATRKALYIKKQTTFQSVMLVKIYIVILQITPRFEPQIDRESGRGPNECVSHQNMLYSNHLFGAHVDVAGLAGLA